MADANSILPPDCWELIFNRVENLEAISLVCKSFLSLSNNLRHDLKVYYSSIKLLSRLLERFRYLKKIDFSDFHGDINQALVETARSVSNLESLDVSWQNKSLVESLTELGSNMKSLKTLKCSYVHVIDNDLMIIACSLPWLEAIDISHGSEDITDDGIEMLTKRLPNLKKINISGNREQTERSLIAISSNCPLLEKLEVRSCDGDINESCLGFLFRHCTNLVSFSGSDFCTEDSSSSSLRFTIENSVAFAKNLCELHFCYQLITDSTLYAIANASLQLKELSLSVCQGWSIYGLPLPLRRQSYSIDGLSTLLRAHQSLVKLEITKAYFLDDKGMSGLFRYLRNLTYINLDDCGNLTSSTLFNLLKSCPLLVEISMMKTGLGKENAEADTYLSKNYIVRNLRLSYNCDLNDELLKKIGLTCPNLRSLDVKSCSDITNDGISEVLKCCNKIKHLLGGQRLRMSLELFESSLEELEIWGVDDEEMEIIAKRCPRLRKLKVSSKNLTNKGVTAVVENCVKLRVIDMVCCDRVSDDILPLMVSTRPSLWKIYPPREFVPTEDQQDLFVLHFCGYLLCNRYDSFVRLE